MPTGTSSERHTLCDQGPIAMPVRIDPLFHTICRSLYYKTVRLDWRRLSDELPTSVFSTISTAQAVEKPSAHTKGKPTGPLKPGEYSWRPQFSPSGPLIVHSDVMGTVQRMHQRLQ
jgi:hypothetical protein